MTKAGQVLYTVCMDSLSCPIWEHLSENVQSMWSIRAEAIVEAGIEERKENFGKSFTIECPECGMVSGRACMNFGSWGGAHNHTARIDAVKSL